LGLVIGAGLIVAFGSLVDGFVGGDVKRCQLNQTNKPPAVKIPIAMIFLGESKKVGL
jgi:hypothetical protein